MLPLPFLLSLVFQSVSETLPSLFHSPVAPVKTFFLPTTEISVTVHFVLGPCRSTFLVVLKSRMETDLFYGTRFTVCFNGPMVLGCPLVLGFAPSTPVFCISSEREGHRCRNGRNVFQPHSGDIFGLGRVAFSFGIIFPMPPPSQPTGNIPGKVHSLVGCESCNCGPRSLFCCSSSDSCPAVLYSHC